MAVTVSGFYGLTLEKFLIDTGSFKGLEAEDNKIALLGAAAGQTPNFDTHNFRDDITETSGTGYAAGGVALTTTEITLSSGTLKFDADDTPWAGASFTSSGGVLHFARGGASSADEIVFLSYFGADVTSAGGTFTIQWHADGIFTIDYTP
jgi:hypothetical protein